MTEFSTKKARINSFLSQLVGKRETFEESGEAAFRHWQDEKTIEITSALLANLNHLSADLTPEWFAMSDAYWETHRRLSGEGKLNHSPEECPERTRGMVVRSWERTAGWKELLVPHAFPPARP